MSVNEHPTTTDPDSVETRVAVAEKRRKLQRIAAGLGLYGAFGTAAFVGEAIAGTISTLEAIHLIVAVNAGIGALFLWRDSRSARLLTEVDTTEVPQPSWALRIMSSMALIVALWPLLRGDEMNPVWLAVAVAFLGLSFIPIRERQSAESDTPD
jgi:hypothetical protein